MRRRCIIGKRWQKAALFACALALALLLLLALLPRAKAGQRALDAAEGCNQYQFDLIFRPEESALAVTMTLRYTNRTGDALDALVLRTWAGAYLSPETSPAAIDEFYDACYPDGFSAGGIQLDGAWWNDELTTADFADDARTVLRVDIPTLAPEESGTLLLRCRLTVPACAHRFGVSQGIWQFGNALPILSRYENGSWRTDAYHPIGDPFVSDCANYDVTLTVPAGYACAASAHPTRETAGDGRWRYRMTAPAARDFSFALSDQLEAAERTESGISVTALAPTAASARAAAKYAAKALAVYRGLYGDYPYESLTVCAADFPFGGMEYAGLMLVSLPAFGEGWEDTLELVIAHETAHQWFYALVGSDQVNDPWQDEAVCEYAMLRYVLSAYGRDAWDNLRITRADAPMRERVPQRVTPGSPITAFGSLDVYSTVVYGRGAAFLLAAEEMTGSLDGFLKAYCDRFAFGFARREDFARLLNEITGQDLLPLMQDYLDTLQ